MKKPSIFRNNKLTIVFLILLVFGIPRKGNAALGAAASAANSKLLTAMLLNSNKMAGWKVTEMLREAKKIQRALDAAQATMKGVQQGAAYWRKGYKEYEAIRDFDYKNREMWANYACEIHKQSCDMYKEGLSIYDQIQLMRCKKRPGKGSGADLFLEDMYEGECGFWAWTKNYENKYDQEVEGDFNLMVSDAAMLADPFFLASDCKTNKKIRKYKKRDGSTVEASDSDLEKCAALEKGDMTFFQNLRKKIKKNRIIQDSLTYRQGLVEDDYNAYLAKMKKDWYKTWLDAEDVAKREEQEERKDCGKVDKNDAESCREFNKQVERNKLEKQNKARFEFEIKMLNGIGEHLATANQHKKDELRMKAVENLKARLEAAEREIFKHIGVDPIVFKADIEREASLLAATNDELKDFEPSFRKKLTEKIERNIKLSKAQQQDRREKIRALIYLEHGIGWPNKQEHDWLRQQFPNEIIAIKTDAHMATSAGKMSLNRKYAKALVEQFPAQMKAKTQGFAQRLKKNQGRDTSKLIMALGSLNDNKSSIVGCSWVSDYQKEFGEGVKPMNAALQKNYDHCIENKEKEDLERRMRNCEHITVDNKPKSKSAIRMCKRNVQRQLKIKKKGEVQKLTGP